MAIYLAFGVWNPDCCSVLSRRCPYYERSRLQRFSASALRDWPGQTVGHSALEKARSGQLALLLVDSLVFVRFKLLNLLRSPHLDVHGLSS